MSKWKGMSEADPTGDKKPWFEPGKYRVRVTGCHEREGRQGDLFYIVEAEVLEIFETSNPDKMKEGHIYSQVIKFNQDMGPINVSRFILAANGLDPNDPENKDVVDEETVEYTLSEDQPLVGTEMELQCDLIKTREKKDFTKYTWFPAERDANEDEDDEDEDADEEEGDDEDAA